MELQNHKAESDTEGVKLFAISYDSVEVLGRFADHYGIEYPVLSDVDSKVIRDFGILNTLVQPHETEYYDIPYPGSYLVDESGTVVAKFFNRQYQVRESAPSMIRMGFNLPIDLASFSHAEAGATGVTVHASLMERELHPRQRSFIYVTLELDEALHVYGDPIPDGYIKTSVVATGTEGLEFGEPQFPPTKPFKIEGIDDEFYTFDGQVEIVVPVVSTIREVGDAEIGLTVSFQACTGEMCYLPRTEKLRLGLTTAPNVRSMEG